MAIPNGGILEAKVQYALSHSSVCQNVFHFRLNCPLQEAEGLCEIGMIAALTDYYNNLEPYLGEIVQSPQVTMNYMQWNAFAGRWDIAWYISDAILTGVAGTSVGEELAPGVAGLVQLMPVYRKHSGFKYIAGFTEGANEADGTPTASVNAALLAMGVDMKNNEYDVETGIATLQYVILDRAGQFHYEPTVAIVRNDWAYQRRRKFLRGL